MDLIKVVNSWAWNQVHVSFNKKTLEICKIFAKLQNHLEHETTEINIAK